MQGMSSMVRGPAASLWVLFLLAASCGPKPPCFGLGVGTRIIITIVDYYSGNPSYPDNPVTGKQITTGCDFGFDLAKGSTIEAIVQSNPDSELTCNAAVVRVALATGWTWQNVSPSGGSSIPTIMFGRYSSSDGHCNGETSIVVNATGDPQYGIFADAAVGQLPPAVLQRRFSSAAWDAGIPNCPNTCIGDFVVSLKKVP